MLRKVVTGGWAAFLVLALMAGPAQAADGSGHGAKDGPGGPHPHAHGPNAVAGDPRGEGHPARVHGTADARDARRTRRPEPGRRRARPARRDHGGPEAPRSDIGTALGPIGLVTAAGGATGSPSRSPAAERAPAAQLRRTDAVRTTRRGGRPARRSGRARRPGRDSPRRPAPRLRLVDGPRGTAHHGAPEPSAPRRAGCPQACAAAPAAGAGAPRSAARSRPAATASSSASSTPAAARSPSTRPSGVGPAHARRAGFAGTTIAREPASRATVRRMPTDTRFWHPFADMHAVRGARSSSPRGEGAVRLRTPTAAATSTARRACGTSTSATAAARSPTPPPRRCASSRATRRSARSPTRPRCELAERLAELAPVDDAADLPRPPAAATRSTPPASSRAATSPRSASPSACTSSAARRATTAPTASARASAASPPTASTWARSTRTRSQVPHDSLEALEAEIERVGAERVAAVFVEPVIGAGGVHRRRRATSRASPSCAAHRRRCSSSTRSSTASAASARGSRAERFGVRPGHDHVRQGRHERLPAARRRRRQRARSRSRSGTRERRHRGSATARPTAGHPTCCAAAMANLDIIEREGLLGARAASSRARSPRALRAARGRTTLVGEVRAGIGALGAVAFAPEALAAHPDLPAARASPRPATTACSCARSATASRSRRRWSPRARRSTTRPQAIGEADRGRRREPSAVTSGA